MVIVKILVNWIFSSLPIIILSSTVVFLLFLPSESLVILLTSLLIGTPVISFGALAGALSLGKSSILGLIVLPLSLPILILGTSAVDSFLNGENPSFFLMMLAIFIFLLPLICYACIGALRLHYE